MAFDWNSYGGTGVGSVQPGRVVSMTPNPVQSAAGAVPQNPMLMNLMAQFKKSSGQANADSLSQYNNLLSSAAGTKNDVNGMFGQANQLLTNFGNSQGQLQQMSNADALGHAGQDLISRGLDNTTIRTSALAGAKMKGDLASNSLAEGVNAQKANLLTQQAAANLSLGHLGADSILSRQNVGPDPNMYLSLLQQLSQTLGSGAGMGGGMASRLG